MAQKPESSSSRATERRRDPGPTIDLTGVTEPRRIGHSWWDVQQARFVRDGQTLVVARRLPKLRLEPAEEQVFFTDGSAYRFVDDWARDVVTCARLDTSAAPSG